MFNIKRHLIPVEVPADVYDCIALAMVNANADVMMIDGALDMRGIGLVRASEPEPLQKHRPISKNTAPGAI